jgi:murein DD-endopeptidase MepM/ murein hydrolase activator NlpD
LRHATTRHAPQPRRHWRRRGAGAAALVFVGIGLGLAGERAVPGDPAAAAPSQAVSVPTDGPERVPARAAAPDPAPAPSPTVSPPPAVPLVVVADPRPLSAADALAIADALAPALAAPSTCRLPLDDPVLMPNSPRSYRSGTHQGIDFVCGARGNLATAALGGRVVVAVGDYVDPTPGDRAQVLATAAQVGDTPHFTLVMMYGNHVVLDHGVIPGVGHVVSVYAHLAHLDPGLRVGADVAAGAVLGEIGDVGTTAASERRGGTGSIHLHWELLVDDRYLGEALGPADTAEVYRHLFVAPSEHDPHATGGGVPNPAVDGVGLPGPASASTGVGHG